MHFGCLKVRFELNIASFLFLDPVLAIFGNFGGQKSWKMGRIQKFLRIVFIHTKCTRKTLVQPILKIGLKKVPFTPTPSYIVCVSFLDCLGRYLLLLLKNSILGPQKGVFESYGLTPKYHN